MRVAGAQRCPVQQLERVVTALERRARVGCVRVALGGQPQHAAWMPQAEARAVARVELAPLLARPPGESRVDLVGAVSVAENPRFVSGTRSRVSRPVRIDERHAGAGIRQVVGRPRSERAGPNHNDVGHGRTYGPRGRGAEVRGSGPTVRRSGPTVRGADASRSDAGLTVLRDGLMRGTNARSDWTIAPPPPRPIAPRGDFQHACVGDLSSGPESSAQLCGVATVRPCSPQRSATRFTSSAFDSARRCLSQRTLSSSPVRQ